MVERKILPERHRGQSWRRMLLNADGWERGKDTMLVDGLETGAVKAMSSEARERLHPQSRHTGAQSPCAATWLLDSYRILREPINGCKQASASPRGQCSARVARQTPRKHRQSTGQSQRGVREAPLTSVKHQDVYGHSGLQEPVSRSRSSRQVPPGHHSNLSLSFTHQNPGSAKEMAAFRVR